MALGNVPQFLGSALPYSIAPLLRAVRMRRPEMSSRRFATRSCSLVPTHGPKRSQSLSSSVASPTMSVAIARSYVAFALNSIVFLLIGFGVRVPALLASWRPILVAYVTVTLGRGLVVVLATLALRRTAERLPWSWSAVLCWDGLRGALSMVLALALPSDLPFGDVLVTVTFGVVVLSILVQGLTMQPLLRWLRIADDGASPLRR